MASTKKPVKKAAGSSWQISWKQFFVALSVAANIAFIVVVITMITSNALDGMFMNEGLKRYCATANNDKFEDTSERTKALREYTCARGEAEQYFTDGFQKYQDFKRTRASE